MRMPARAMISYGPTEQKETVGSTGQFVGSRLVPGKWRVVAKMALRKWQLLHEAMLSLLGWQKLGGPPSAVAGS
jgi:hypothetical protein